MAFAEKFRAFAKTYVGMGTLLALSVVLVSLSLVYGGVVIGALVLIVLAFGLPIYVGWQRPLRNFIVIALVIVLATAPLASVFLTQELLAPSSPASSGDGVLSDAVVTPFSSNGAHYNFSLQVAPNPTPYKGYRVSELILWVTDCSADSNTSENNCGGSPHDFFDIQNVTLTPAQQNASTAFPFSLVLSLAKGQIYYYIWYYGVSALNETDLHWWAFQGTFPPGYSGPTYTEGPVTGTFGPIYGIVLEQIFFVMLELGVLVLAAILIYTYLKGRQGRRRAQAQGAAAGIAPGGTPLPGAGTKKERTCPQCNSVVDSEETFCWKCGKELTKPSAPSA